MIPLIRRFWSPVILTLSVATMLHWHNTVTIVIGAITIASSQYADGYYRGYRSMK